jgi:hypothetical protein
MNTETIAYDAGRPVEDWCSPAPQGELGAIHDVIKDGRLSGGAPAVASYESALAAWLGVPHVVAVTLAARRSTRPCTFSGLGTAPT